MLCSNLKAEVLSKENELQEYQILYEQIKQKSHNLVSQLKVKSDKPESKQLKDIEHFKAALTAMLQEAELWNIDLQNEVDDLIANICDPEDQLKASISNVQEIIHELEDTNEELCKKIKHWSSSTQA